ncbi:MAG: hypothetical protein MUO64_13565 [Anaerolineales bacterium]|nr:hypothetical protein [Anaerolineales bacterium]
MTFENRITQLVRRWDEEELFSLSTNVGEQHDIPIENTYRDTYMYLESLVKFRFVPYLNDEIQGFWRKLWIWINQFETNDEKKLAFKIASSITFITEDQIRHLQEVCFQEKLRFHLLDEIIIQKKLVPYSYEDAIAYFEEKLDECLIVALTDSARYNQFVHINGLENHSRLGLKSIGVLVHPDIISTSEVVNKLKKRYENKRILIIIEDFCGSGKTFITDLVRISTHYDNFLKVYFCPYIITDHAEKTIRRFARKFTPNIILEILPGMTISEFMRAFSRSSVLFSYEEQKEIKKICVKYHKKYFSDHKFIGKPRSYPYGYRNGQLLLVLQSNCPNHTLPIIWAQENGWKPLFKRIQRYA